MHQITIKQVLEAAESEYTRIYLKVRTWDKYGIQVLDEEGYCIKDENNIWSLEDNKLTIDFETDIASFKWRGELDKDCPVLCVNRRAHWIEFDPNTHKVKDMCQVHDGYQAYLARKETMKAGLKK